MSKNADNFDGTILSWIILRISSFVYLFNNKMESSRKVALPKVKTSFLHTMAWTTAVVHDYGYCFCREIKSWLEFYIKTSNTIGYLVSSLNFLIDSGCVFIQNASTVLTLWLKSAAVSRRFFDLQKLKLSKCLSLSHTQPQEHDQQHP